MDHATESQNQATNFEGAHTYAKNQLQTQAHASCAVSDDSTQTDVLPDCSKSQHPREDLNAQQVQPDHDDAPARKPRKNPNPARSLPSHAKTPHLTAHDREAAGIVALDVYSVYRVNPFSLLITNEEARRKKLALELEQRRRKGMHQNQRNSGGKNRGQPRAANHRLRILQNDGIVESNVVVGSRRSVTARATAAAAAATENYKSSGSSGEAKDKRIGNDDDGPSFGRLRRGSVFDSGISLIHDSKPKSLTSPRKRKRSERPSGNDGLESANERTASPNIVTQRTDSNSSKKSRKTQGISTKLETQLFTSWDTLGSGTGAAHASATVLTPKQSPTKHSGGSKIVTATGDGNANDKVRPLPFQLITQEQIEEYTQCKDAGEVVSWKKSPISFSSDVDGYSKLADDELETCSILRVPPVDYLQVKHILLSARSHFDTFTKRQAQKWYGIDVNKTGKIFDWFVSKSWLLLPSKGKAKK
ncbi:hypothetical protein HDU83_001637 [Entophlyctis luteolus]|nr:hypothetical protein HDU83_001637 [Entophlyctis luteolus]